MSSLKQTKFNAYDSYDKRLQRDYGAFAVKPKTLENHLHTRTMCARVCAEHVFAGIEGAHTHTREAISIHRLNKLKIICDLHIHRLRARFECFKVFPFSPRQYGIFLKPSSSYNIMLMYLCVVRLTAAALIALGKSRFALRN